MQKRNSTPNKDACGCCRQQPLRHSPSTQNFMIERVAKFALAFIFASFPIIARYLHSVNAILSSSTDQFKASDLFWVWLGWFFSVAIKRFSRSHLASSFAPYLKTDCNKTLDSTRDKLEKIGDNIRGMTIDVLVFALATVFTLDTDLYPAGFGGSLNITEDQWMRDAKESNYGARVVLLLVLGHYVERIWFEIAESRKSPIFFTKLFHHILTIFLIVSCLATGSLHMGLPVILTHSVTGIFLCASRILNETVFEDMYHFNYLLLLIAWFYSRIFVFLTEIVVPFTKGLYSESELAARFRLLHAVLLAFLLLLLGFDVYWGSQLAIIGVRKNIVWLQIQDLSLSARMN